MEIENILQEITILKCQKAVKKTKLKKYLLLLSLKLL